MTTSPSAPITTITQLRDTAQHILDHWPPPPAVRRLVVLDHAILRKPTSATLEILAEATAAEAALALEVGLRVGWALARSTTPASDVDAWADAALKQKE
jgi:hypothetical protein